MALTVGLLAGGVVDAALGEIVFSLTRDVGSLWAWLGRVGASTKQGDRGCCSNQSKTVRQEDNLGIKWGERDLISK